MKRRRLFDFFGVISVLAFAAAIAADYGELAWPAREIELEPAAAELADGFRPGVAWYGLYQRDAKVGFLRIDRRRRGDGFEMRSRTVLEISMAGRRHPLAVDVDASLDGAMAVRRFEVTVSGDLVRVAAEGRWSDDRLELVVRAGDSEQRRTVRRDRPPVLDVNLGAQLMRQRPAPGERLRFDQFDPLTLSTTTVELEYLGRDRIAVVDAEVPAHRLRQRVAGQWLQIWVNDLGEVLREELPIGLVAVRETEAVATFELAQRRRLGEAADGGGLDLVELLDRPAGGGGDR